MKEKIKQVIHISEEEYSRQRDHQLQGPYKAMLGIIANLTSSLDVSFEQRNGLILQL